MTKAHPHRQVNVHLDTVDDADVIERIAVQPSMVGYIRELVRRDIHDERLDYVALKTSELQSENAKLRELVSILVHCMNEVDNCHTCPINGNLYDVRAGEWAACDTLRDMLRELGVEASE